MEGFLLSYETLKLNCDLSVILAVQNLQTALFFVVFINRRIAAERALPPPSAQKLQYSNKTASVWISGLETATEVGKIVLQITNYV